MGRRWVVNSHEVRSAVISIMSRANRLCTYIAVWRVNAYSLWI